MFLEDVELCKNRIRVRVQKGGHDVPSIEIERRFRRSLVNFQNIYMPLADTWQLFYNGLWRPLEVAVGEKGQIIMILYEEFYHKFLEVAE